MCFFKAAPRAARHPLRIKQTPFPHDPPKPLFFLRLLSLLYFLVFLYTTSCKTVTDEIRLTCSYFSSVILVACSQSPAKASLQARFIPFSSTLLTKMQLP